MSDTPLTDSVVPHQALGVPHLPDDPRLNDALVAVATACNGFAYSGGDLEAQIRAIRFLRTRPDIVSALGLVSGD